ncbi:hypothetical protein J5N97_007130 [Dioscorea zingiberensis]|uniref:Bidirectional sugar transporter SWEET n=1 Tax=Dioscorea zingiberensis TaxID=325984 RepID=A0A9D5HTX9_9LILI|nr:hypothetical protein J5N97_007130 [Dioscorea zingiberensis]
MAGLSLDHPWAFAFGILGNIVSFMVYLAPLPTFYRVYRKKSTEGFQSVPYVAALFSSMLWIYYALVKTDTFLLITINSFGCFVETIYIIYTAKLILLLNVGLFGLIVLITLLLTKGENRVTLLGWICVGFAVSVFVSPLSVIKLVIKTKSAEFMPFSLSLFLTLSAVFWFGYGLTTKDIYVAIPNILGFLFGLIQMVLFMVYKNGPKVSEEKVADETITVVVIPDQSREIEMKNASEGEEQAKGMGVREENVVNQTLA